ncbi:MAG: 5-formyltetrahydrofolate cyclo-ligase [Gammaproteobacteria bacterium]|nr:5-formyltetrahydrofolate cyclo-ligase [Gammaproteobacteria bacterium]
MTRSDNLQAHRQQLRQQRAALSEAEQVRAARSVRRLALRVPALSRAERIAVYLPMGGELDPGPCTELFWQREQAVFLPCLEGDTLGFRRFTPDTELQRNRFDIPEPVDTAERLDGRDLDAVLAPLVGFDRSGNRLGMGGGFYDRTFAFLTPRKRLQRPKLFGLAYAFQEIDKLEPADWDVPVDGILTPNEYIRT